MTPKKLINIYSHNIGIHSRGQAKLWWRRGRVELGLEHGDRVVHCERLETQRGEVVTIGVGILDQELVGAADPGHLTRFIRQAGRILIPHPS